MITIDTIFPGRIKFTISPDLYTKYGQKVVYVPANYTPMLVNTTDTVVELIIKNGLSLKLTPTDVASVTTPYETINFSGTTATELADFIDNA